MQANLAFQMLWNAATIGGGNVKTRNMCRGRRNIQMWQGQNFQEKKTLKMNSRDKFSRTMNRD